MPSCRRSGLRSRSRRCRAATTTSCIDAGALPEIAPEKFARLAPRAVLVADDVDGPATESARERLLSAGFPNVSVLASSPDGPEYDAGGNRAAA